MADEDIIPQWARLELEQFLKEQEITSYTSKICKATIKGDNYLGVIAKATVKGFDKTGRNTILNLILKMAPENEQFRQYVYIVPLYEREVFFYESVAPAMIEFQQKLDGPPVFNPFAKYYKSSLKSCQEILIMEDMKTHDFIMKDRKQPMDLQHCLFVMKEYGRFHAVSFAMKDQQNEIYEKLLEGSEEHYFSQLNLDELCKTVSKCCEKAKESLDPNLDKEVYVKLAEFCEFPKTKLRKILSLEEAGEHAVITHGDCWTNNILFKYTNKTQPTVPTEICILDWQLSRCGSPALDLAYFIFTCTDKSLRDKHYEELLQTYHSSLTSTLKSFGSDADQLFPFSVLQDHMKRFSSYGLMMAMMVIHLMLSESEDMPEWTSDMTDDERNAIFDGTNKDLSGQRVADVVIDYTRLGYD